MGWDWVRFWFGIIGSILGFDSVFKWSPISLDEPNDDLKEFLGRRSGFDSPSASLRILLNRVRISYYNLVTYL